MEATLLLSARWSHRIVREGVLTLDGIPMWDCDGNKMQVVTAADTTKVWGGRLGLGLRRGPGRFACYCAGEVVCQNQSPDFTG
jgi:hypothetical protein